MFMCDHGVVLVVSNPGYGVERLSSRGVGNRSMCVKTGLVRAMVDELSGVRVLSLFGHTEVVCGVMLGGLTLDQMEMREGVRVYGMYASGVWLDGVYVQSRLERVREGHVSLGRVGTDVDAAQMVCVSALDGLMWMRLSVLATMSVDVSGGEKVVKTG
jgi:hypothetical protein